MKELGGVERRGRAGDGREKRQREREGERERGEGFREGFARGLRGVYEGAGGGWEGEERIGRVVCCGLLRLGRDSSTPTIAG